MSLKRQGKSKGWGGGGGKMKPKESLFNSIQGFWGQLLKCSALFSNSSCLTSSATFTLLIWCLSTQMGQSLIWQLRSLMATNIDYASKFLTPISTVITQNFRHYSPVSGLPNFQASSCMEWNIKDLIITL